jgi:agmatinase
MRTLAPERGFLDAPIETDLARLVARVAVLGVPFGSPYRDPGATVGCAAAPAAVRRRSQRLARFAGHWDFDLDGPMDVMGLVDAGDVPGDPQDGPGNVATAEAAVRAVLERGIVPICLGGDDSVPIPILRAFAEHGPITVVHVDAHLDFRDEVDGVRDGYSSSMRRASEMPHVERIVQVGLRGVGSARANDLDDARRAGNVLITAAEARRSGIGEVLRSVPDDASVFLSFDCDGLDPSVLPAVSGLAPGGLTYADAVHLMRRIGSRLVGAVFTEYVPRLDTEDRAALVVARLATVAAATVDEGEDKKN